MQDECPQLRTTSKKRAFSWESAKARTHTYHERLLNNKSSYWFPSYGNRKKYHMWLSYLYANRRPTNKVTSHWTSSNVYPLGLTYQDQSLLTIAGWSYVSKRWLPMRGHRPATTEASIRCLPVRKYLAEAFISTYHEWIAISKQQPYLCRCVAVSK